MAEKQTTIAIHLFDVISANPAVALRDIDDRPLRRIRRDSPGRVRQVIGDDERAARVDCHADRAATGLVIFAQKASREVASTVTTIDRYRPAGIVAQASLACTRALMRPSTHMTSNATK